MKENKINALTIDVEDAVNQAMRNFFHTGMAPTYRVCDNTRSLLDLFAEFDVKATFFILGEVAETYPDLIKEIAFQGHELGIHGLSHTRYDLLSPDEVRNEILTAKKMVEDITGVEVVGHRAPEFSINGDNRWVFDILAESGIKYDSSIFPAKVRRYGWTGFNKDIDWLTLDSGRRIVEAPLTTISYFGREIPACGGGYLRIFPFFFTKNAFERLKEVRPVNVYMHPYEIDLPPFQDFYNEAVSKSAFMNKIKIKSYWFNRSTVLPKLRKLLKIYRFTTLRNVINMTMDADI